MFVKKKMVVVLGIMVLCCGCSSKTGNVQESKIGSLSQETEVVQKAEQEITETIEVTEGVVYHKTGYMQEDETEGFYIIEAVEDYDAFYDDLEKFHFSGLEDKKETQFFDDNVVIVVSKIENSGSNVLTFKGIELSGNIAAVKIKREYGGTGTCDMVSYLIEIPISRETLMDKEVEVIYEE